MCLCMECYVGMLIKVYIENKGKTAVVNVLWFDLRVSAEPSCAAPVSSSKSPSTGGHSGEAGRSSLKESQHTPTLAALREKCFAFFGQSHLQRKELGFGSSRTLQPNEKIVTIPLRPNNFQNTTRDMGLFSEVFGTEFFQC